MQQMNETEAPDTTAPAANTNEALPAPVHDSRIETIARVCHEANRAYALATGEDPSKVHKRWESVDEEIRQSSRRGVQTRLDGATQRELHESWCEGKRADGWVYGEVRDNDARIHPCLVDYDALPESQRKKDDLFAGIVDALK